MQKIRRVRAKDLDDARDVLAVQGFERVDVVVIRSWWLLHGTADRLDAVIAAIPPG